MKSVLSLCVLLLAVNMVEAVPRFALMEDINCTGCHSYNGGGAGRNTYGKEYVIESLTMKNASYPWVDEERESAVYFGLDTRYQLIASQDEDVRNFPMQLALYSGAEWGNAIGHFEVNRINDTYRVTGGLRYDGLPFETWVSLSRELPVMGWRIDDHTVFTRGGNLTPLGLDREGLPLTPFVEAPDMIEVGSEPLLGLELSLMSGTSFLSRNEDYFSALKASYNHSGDFVTVKGELALLVEGGTELTVASWGVAVSDFVWLGEVSILENWPQQNLTNLALLYQLSYRVAPGLDLIGRYEFFDQNTTLKTGAIGRYSLGVELFPIPGIELKLSYRRSQLDLPVVNPSPQGQFLGQLHVYL